LSARRSLRALLAGSGLCLALLTAGQAAGQAPVRAEIGAPRLSAQARAMADQVIATGDAQGLPFVIVDKIEARVIAFDAGGRLIGAAPALLGLARGDRSPPGIGGLRLANIPPAQRITPAGRFEAQLGANLAGHRILWIDYEAALSLHPVVTSNAAEHRLRRLATPSVLDNRISYGCINVPPAFYEGVVQPLFGPAGGIVYILPESPAA
jgi:hypothetical protein